MFELITAATFDARTGRARAAVPADVPFLADHFPGAPVLPGSLQLELCAQIAGPLAERAVLADQKVERWAFLGMVRNAVFHRPVALPAELLIAAELKRVEPSSVVVVVSASAGGEQACRGELVMMLRDADPAWAGATAEARARVARWEAAW